MNNLYKHKTRKLAGSTWKKVDGEVLYYRPDVKYYLNDLVSIRFPGDTASWMGLLIGLTGDMQLRVLTVSVPEGYRSGAILHVEHSWIRSLNGHRIVEDNPLVTMNLT